ncbi:3-hydroxy-9,10-secoandrosta-1,3,5(10)-triene-9,17-dione monooxygenase oxygenase subunit [Nocardioides sp. YIM 152315]|uniref:3-hydroxy-9,10-secoandrosta-1,3,5(10)-triene-9, 17-dione monooxygenase oxygenase subunit n=1 Tax=Nocardioides sp. YIM 152315 TaxID=3031760 RepID=UPI0023DA0D28|nr:3-hydroxy-9,10-secoandrosta-1,3,5(10)-triene-9,17-dione monooxygenase oxygenase subunit [Nocardioides sp. YIM 152315]MDF1604107.1 flavin-dependent monooxygenase [Nocardioides sp. YIM 152315]
MTTPAQTDTVLDRVRPLLPTIAGRAAEADETRRVPEPTIAELTAAGVFRMLQPKRYGGAEAHPVEFFEVVRALSGACGSTGWVASVLGVHPWQVALFEEQAQDEVWSADPDVLISSAYAPIGRLVREGGAYRLSGRWSFSSGCDHAGWALLGALAPPEAGGHPEFVTLLVPRRDYRVIDVWDTVGLRGTGSNDVEVDDALVPAHRVLRNAEHSRLTGPGQQVNPGPLYRIPFGAVFSSAITSPIVGAVAGCLDDYVAAMQHRTRGSLGGGRFAEDQFAQVALARAASEVDAAVLQMERNLRELVTCATDGEIPFELRLRTRRDQVRATERTLEAVDLLFKTAGGHSLRRGNTIERAWRDAHAGSVHVANDVERALASYGRGLFGLDVEETLL